jgi:hypothetical protein
MKRLLYVLPVLPRPSPSFPPIAVGTGPPWRKAAGVSPTSIRQREETGTLGVGRGHPQWLIMPPRTFQLDLTEPAPEVAAAP